MVVAININTCAEYKPHIKIRHMTNVMIDAANKHMDKYRNIHKSYLIKLIDNTSILIKKNLQYSQHQQDCMLNFYIDSLELSTWLVLIL